VADAGGGKRTAGRGLGDRLIRPEAISGQTARRERSKRRRGVHFYATPVRSDPEIFGGEIPGHRSTRQKGEPNDRSCRRTVRTSNGIRGCCSTAARIRTPSRSSAAGARRRDRRINNRSAGAAPWPPPPRSSIGAAPAGDLASFVPVNSLTVELSDDVQRLISTTLTASDFMDLQRLCCEKAVHKPAPR